MYASIEKEISKDDRIILRNLCKDSNQEIFNILNKHKRKTGILPLIRLPSTLA